MLVLIAAALLPVSSSPTWPRSPSPRRRASSRTKGLYVTLEAQANWKVILDRVITGELDGAHMLAGQPIGATIGFGTKAHVVTAVQHGPERQRHHRLERGLAAQMKPNMPRCARQAGASDQGRRAEAGDRALQGGGKPFNMGMVFPVSTHNYELRYWLAAGGINPGFYSPGDVTGRSRPMC